MSISSTNKTLLCVLMLLCMLSSAHALVTVYTNNTVIVGSNFGSYFMTTFNGSPYSYIEYNVTFNIPIAILSNAPKTYFDSNASNHGDEDVFFEWQAGSSTYTLKNEPGYDQSIANIPGGQINISYYINYTARTAKFCVSGSCTSAYSFGRDGNPYYSVAWGALSVAENISRVTAAVLEAEGPDTTPPNYNISNSSITNSSAMIFSNASEASNLSINWGTTLSLGNIVNNATKTTNLFVNLTGLPAGTLIYYNASRCDSSNNCNLTGGYFFTTQSNPPPPANLSACNNTVKGNLLVDNPRPYNDIGGLFTFNAYYVDAKNNPIIGNHTLVSIIMNNQTYNMTFDGTKYSITITSTESEDVPIIVNATNDYYTCVTVGFTTRFRTPWTVRFQLYKEPLNSTDPARYSNEFQYVVVINNAQKSNIDLMSYGVNSLTKSLFDNTLGLLSGTAYPNLNQKKDTNVYFWGAYSNGEATIKLYEPGNYSVYVMNNKVSYPNNYFWEFERPTTQDIDYMGNIYDHLQVYDPTNISNTPTAFNGTLFRVSFSKVEANTYYAAMNWFKILIVVFLYLFGFVLIFMGFKDSPNLGNVIVTYIGIATPIAISFIFYFH